jgi:hypothetical protein
MRFLKMVGLIKSDPEEEALVVTFIQVSLMQSLSYHEWRDLTQVLEILKSDKQTAELLKKVTKGKEDREKLLIFIILTLMGKFGIAGMRFENQEEYVASNSSGIEKMSVEEGSETEQAHMGADDGTRRLLKFLRRDLSRDGTPQRLSQSLSWVTYPLLTQANWH